MGDQHPTEPVVDDNGKSQGGFAWIAGQLNKDYPHRQRPISRQLVHKWWTRRSWNKFPEAIGTVGSGKGHPVFSRNAVMEWYKRYRDTRGAPEEEETTPRDTGESDALAA